MGLLKCQRCRWRKPDHVTPFHGCSFEDFKGYEKRLRLGVRGWWDDPERGPRYTDEEVDALLSDDKIPSYYDMKHACSGVSALCEPCWKKLTPLERLRWHQEVFKLWPPTTPLDERKPNCAYRDTERDILRTTASVLNGY